MRFSDCGAALVTNLPTEPDLDPGSAEVLWAGIDPNTFAAIKAALQEADIPFEDTGRSPHIVSGWTRPPYEIWTYKRDHGAAQRILTWVLGEPSPESEPIAQREGGNGRDTSGELPPEELLNDPPGPVPDDLLENFNPDHATSEIWSGEEAAMAKFLQDSLQANGIGSVIRAVESSERRLLVRPADEPSARQIIREVLEATPPE